VPAALLAGQGAGSEPLLELPQAVGQEVAGRPGCEGIAVGRAASQRQHGGRPLEHRVHATLVPPFPHVVSVPACRHHFSRRSGPVRQAQPGRSPLVQG